MDYASFAWSVKVVNSTRQTSTERHGHLELEDVTYFAAEANDALDALVKGQLSKYQWWCTLILCLMCV